MDLDGDGRRDVISGSWPGELYLFRGTEKGLAAATKLAFADGKEINLGSASTVFAHDWEGDGDLDLLVGDIDGNVHLVTNASGGKALAFQAAVPVRCGGKALEVHGDSAPIVADWDGDGRHDLIVGAGDGAVTWYRDLAKEGAPLLARGTLLLTPAPNHGQREPGDKAPRCGSRTKPAVADWDRDGDLDLLVGDFSSGSGEEPELTAEQVKRRDELQAEQQKLAEDFAQRFEKAMREAAREAGLEVPEAGPFAPPGDRAQQQKIQERAFARLQADGGFFEAYQARMQALWNDLQPLMPAHEAHGHVWFFARESGGAPRSESAPAEALAPSQAPRVVPALPVVPAQRVGADGAAPAPRQAAPAATPVPAPAAPPPPAPAAPRPPCR